MPTTGRSILHWFDNHTAAELRLWDAIDLRLLAPFHYFGIHDHVDLSRVGWVRGRYNQRELTALYEANQRRADLIIQAVHENVAEVARVRALGFCVGRGSCPIHGGPIYYGRHSVACHNWRDTA